jgi:hypothetical protein
MRIFMAMFDMQKTIPFPGSEQYFRWIEDAFINLAVFIQETFGFKGTGVVRIYLLIMKD